MKFILGEKQNMTQIFAADGEVFPVTIVKIARVVVTQVKNIEKDGYSAVQVGFGVRNKKNVKKPQVGHLKDLLDSEGGFKVLKEFRTTETMNVGDKVELGSFAEGEEVTVSSISKGKGFQGVVKRHGFGGGPRTHGQKHSEREAGSISQGLRTGPHRGLRMAGRMGTDRITQKNMKIVQVNTEAGTIALKGAVAGRRGTLVEIVGAK